MTDEKKSAPNASPARWPTLDEAIEYGDRRFRAAEADGNDAAAGAYLILLDFMRNARFDVPAAPTPSAAQESPGPSCPGVEDDAHALAGTAEAIEPLPVEGGLRGSNPDTNPLADRAFGTSAATPSSSVTECDECGVRAADHLDPAGIPRCRDRQACRARLRGHR